MQCLEWTFLHFISPSSYRLEERGTAFYVMVGVTIGDGKECGRQVGRPECKFPAVSLGD